ncbi:hypothetical protein [Nocardia sp. NPDC057455]
MRVLGVGVIIAFIVVSVLFRALDPDEATSTPTRTADPGGPGVS